MGNNADSHKLLSVVASVHHEGVGQSLDDGAVGLAESLDGISTGGVRDVDGVSQRNVVTIRVGSKEYISKQVSYTYMYRPMIANLPR